ncbi:fungal-specific transcription factor domain-containing protein [Scheffersomyces coipomensis]|uniref:fungal-specific transcription factor domain-containing protein n=1 Tax=Scheffersomyces coipomensis TaxID=1788519 RepID=UPI00315E0065
MKGGFVGKPRAKAHLKTTGRQNSTGGGGELSKDQLHDDSTNSNTPSSIIAPPNRPTNGLTDENFNGDVPSKDIMFNSPRFLGMRASSANLEQFSSELFEDLESLLKSPDSSIFSDESASNRITNSMSAANFAAASEMRENISLNLGKEIIGFIDKSNVLPEEESAEKLLEKRGPTEISLYSMSYQEENMMLKHFFKKLLPLLDAHPNSPWPDLALKYCDFDIARSCFISLACIHMYESRKGGNEYYQKGVAHINNTMDHLIRFISTDNLSTAEDEKKKQIHSLVILVLINVHILFAVLEKGKSSLSRFFFKVFASICQDQDFYGLLITNEKQRSLSVVLSWYDTVSAIVSPDCRLPYCLPSWYGSSSDNISTSKMMGCPGQIFKAMSKVCYLRHDVYNGADNTTPQMLTDYQNVKQLLVNYRDYVLFEDGDEEYAIRLKCAQCWSIAVWITLERVIRPFNYEINIRKLVHEFISIYGSMEPISPMVTQMVWPVYAIGCECKTAEERASLMTFMETLYRNAQMGTLFSLKEIVQQVWALQISQEEFLKQWLDSGVDYLPL